MKTGFIFCFYTLYTIYYYFSVCGKRERGNGFKSLDEIKQYYPIYSIVLEIRTLSADDTTTCKLNIIQTMCIYLIDILPREIK